MENMSKTKERYGRVVQKARSSVKLNSIKTTNAADNNTKGYKACSIDKRYKAQQQ